MTTSNSRSAGGERHPAEMALEHDRTKVAECVTRVKAALKNYNWLIDSRGSYEWNDDRWHGEFKRAHDEIRAAIEPMVRIAADWSNCPKTWEEVQQARAAQPARGSEKLRELIAKWRDTAVSGARAETAFALDKCAKELEALLAAPPAPPTSLGGHIEISD